MPDAADTACRNPSSEDVTDQPPLPSPILFWGVYDTGKPRVRLLLDAARRLGVRIIEIHTPVWTGVEDKSRISGIASRLTWLARWMAAYPGLVARYLTAPSHRVVIISHLGLLDALVLWPWARLRGARIVWDMFMSVYDTVVRDRALAAPRSITARLLYGAEWVATRLVDRIFLDTAAHAKAVADLFGLAPESCGHVFVGAEELFHQRTPPSAPNSPPEVLFYGQFIPLQGVEVIVEAARILAEEGADIHWTLIGQGQDSAAIDQRINELLLPCIRRIPWVPYEELPERIAAAHVTLGIFGDSRKALSVIPNKVYQALACGSRLVTADTPAMRELLPEPPPGIALVPPRDPAALANAVRELTAPKAPRPTPAGPGPDTLARQLAVEIRHAAC